MKACMYPPPQTWDHGRNSSQKRPNLFPVQCSMEHLPVFELVSRKDLIYHSDLDTTFIKGKNRVVFKVLLRGLRDGSAGKMLTALTEDTGSIPHTHGAAATGGSDFWPPWALALRCTPSHMHIIKSAGNLWCSVGPSSQGTSVKLFGPIGFSCVSSNSLCSAPARVFPHDTSG